MRLGKKRDHVPRTRPCGRCGAMIRSARTDAAGPNLYVDAAPVPDQGLRGREKPDAGLVSFRLDSTAVLHTRAELDEFFPRPAYRIHECPT